MTEPAWNGPPPPFGFCPNCRGGEVIRVEGGRGVDGNNNAIVTGAFSFVAVARLVCLSCGYLRDWVDRPGDLQKLREKYGWQLRPR
jgi:hypothetical protein